MTNPVSHPPTALADYQAWLNGIKQRIHATRMKVALAANGELITLYYEIGAQIIDRETPTIGLLLCRDKNNIEVEFALRDMNKPMGVSEYTLMETLPENLKGALPTVEEIEAELANDHEAGQ